MARLAICFLLSISMTTTAFASGSLSCSNADGVSIDIGMGRLPVSYIFSTSIEVDGETLSMANGDFDVGQDYLDSNKFVVDYVDSNVESVLVRLRLFSALEQDNFAMAGILQIADKGAYSVVCDEWG